MSVCPDNDEDEELWLFKANEASSFWIFFRLHILTRILLRRVVRFNPALGLFMTTQSEKGRFHFFLFLSCMCADGPWCIPLGSDSSNGHNFAQSGPRAQHRQASSTRLRDAKRASADWRAAAHFSQRRVSCDRTQLLSAFESQSFENQNDVFSLHNWLLGIPSHIIVSCRTVEALWKITEKKTLASLNVSTRLRNLWFSISLWKDCSVLMVRICLRF